MISRTYTSSPTLGVAHMRLAFLADICWPNTDTRFASTGYSLVDYFWKIFISYFSTLHCSRSILIVHTGWRLVCVRVLRLGGGIRAIFGGPRRRPNRKVPDGSVRGGAEAVVERSDRVAHYCVLHWTRRHVLCCIMRSLTSYMPVQYSLNLVQ